MSERRNGTGLAAEFAKKFAANGGTVLGTQKTSDKDTDFNALVTKMKATNPDLIYYGGIYNAGTLTLLRSSVSGNGAGSASGTARGGGVANYGQLLVLDSTIAGNGAASLISSSYGGGLYNESPVNLATLKNVTVAGNISGNGANGHGAGFYIASMAQVYPEDRGTNYAIREGRKVGRLVAQFLSPLKR